jgi:serine/threonine protein kinase
MLKIPKFPFTLPYILSNPKPLSELKRLIVKGENSYVYFATAIQKKESYVIKVIPRLFLKGRGDLNHLQREIDSIAFLNHENIVHLQDFFSDGECFFLVTEYCPDGTLFDMVAKNQIMSEGMASQIFVQIVKAVDFLHQNGVVHRDLNLQYFYFRKKS